MARHPERFLMEEGAGEYIPGPPSRPFLLELPQEVLAQIFNNVYESISEEASTDMWSKDVFCVRSDGVRIVNRRFAGMTMICRRLCGVTTTILYGNLVIMNWPAGTTTTDTVDPVLTQQRRLFTRQSILLHRTLGQNPSLRCLCRHLTLLDTRVTTQHPRPGKERIFYQLEGDEYNNTLARVLGGDNSGYDTSEDENLGQIMGPLVDDIVVWLTSTQSLYLLMTAEDIQGTYANVDLIARSMSALQHLEVWGIHHPLTLDDGMTDCPNPTKIINSLQSPQATCCLASLSFGFTTRDGELDAHMAQVAEALQNSPIEHFQLIAWLNHQPETYPFTWNLELANRLLAKVRFSVVFLAAWDNSLEHQENDLNTHTTLSLAVENESSTSAELVLNQCSMKIFRSLNLPRLTSLGVTLMGPPRRCGDRPYQRPWFCCRYDMDRLVHCLLESGTRTMAWRLGGVATIKPDQGWPYLGDWFRALQRLVKDFPDFQKLELECVPRDPAWVQVIRHGDQTLAEDMRDLASRFSDLEVDFHWVRPSRTL